jgi:hypothetical protein
LPGPNRAEAGFPVAARLPAPSPTLPVSIPTRVGSRSPDDGCRLSTPTRRGRCRCMAGTQGRHDRCGAHWLLWVRRWAWRLPCRHPLSRSLCC